MKKRRLIIAAICGAGVLLSIWIAHRHAQELVYEGKPIRTFCWQLYAGTTTDRAAATAAFKSMGGRAVPELTRLLESKDPFFRKTLWALGARLPAGLRLRLLHRMRPLDKLATRQGAARGLAVIGPEATPAIPALTRMLHNVDDRNHWEAAVALGKIGPAAVPALTTALSDKQKPVRHAAAYALGIAGPGAGPAIPALVQALNDKDDEVANSAAYSLTQIGPAAVDPVLAVIDHGQGKGRELMARHLISFYSARMQSVPALANMAADPLPSARSQAMETLGTLQLGTPSAIAALTAGLKDTNTDVRLAAIQALGKLSVRAEPAVPALIGCLQDESAPIRESAARTLGHIGPAARSAVIELSRLAGDRESGVRAGAEEALGKIKPAQP